MSKLKKTNAHRSKLSSIKDRTTNAVKDKLGLPTSNKGKSKKIDTDTSVNEGLMQGAMGRVTEKIVQIAKAVARFIMINKIPIFIGMCVVALIFIFANAFFSAVGITRSFNKSPHYYCDVNAPQEVKESALYKQYCTQFTSSSNNSIAEAAISLATVDTSGGLSKINYTTDGLSDVRAKTGVPGYHTEPFVSVTPQLLQVLSKLQAESARTTIGWMPYSSAYYASCDLTVAMAVWWSGADDNFPACLLGSGEYNGDTYGQTGYLIHGNHGKWEQLTKGSPVLPGDIAIGRNSPDGYIGHVWMYVATWENGSWTDNSLVQEKFPGSKANRYEGSWKDYYAKVGYDSNPWESSEYIFRYVGTIDENSEFKKIQQ